MDFSELIRVRESVRTYDPARPVSRETLLRVLDKSRLAPSAKNIQPWQFIVISEPGLLGRVKECYHREWLHDAPHVLAIVGDKHEAYVRGYDGHSFIETDLAIVMTYVVLSAADEGVATCWIANFDPQRMHTVLGLPSHEVVYSITPLGYPKSDYRPKGVKDRKSLDNLVIWR